MAGCLGMMDGRYWRRTLVEGVEVLIEGVDVGVGRPEGNRLEGAEITVAKGICAYYRLVPESTHLR